MSNIKVALINESTVVNSSDVPKVADALKVQVSRDFAPAWGVDADLRFVSAGQKPNAGEWWLAILDDSDQAGALGYHDVTSEGLPLAKVFAKTDLNYNEIWSVTASHELLEMLGDPEINLTVFVEAATGGRLYAYEVCDACEADKFGYNINGVLVSDFVYPSWFESFQKQGAQFDFTKNIKQPFQLLSGGYIGVYDVTAGSGWKQITADKSNFRSRPPVGSRRERRSIPIEKRIVSTVFAAKGRKRKK